MGDVIEFKQERYIVYVFGAGGELVAMRKTRQAAEDLLAENNVTVGKGGDIVPVGPESAWYNGVC